MSCDWSMMSWRSESRVRKRLKLKRKLPEAGTGFALVFEQVVHDASPTRTKSVEHLPGPGSGASPSLASNGSRTQVPEAQSESSWQKERSPCLGASMAATTKPAL